MRTLLLRSSIAALLLGGVGLLCGYFGPSILNAEAAQGPLLGIFVTAPLAFAIGIVIGVATATLKTSSSVFVIVLMIALVTTGGVSLYLSLPEDRFEAFVVDGEVQACQSAEVFLPAAEARWNKLNNDNPWEKPRPNWRRDIQGMLERDQGVVVTLIVHRRWDIYERRKPWNRGRLTAKASNEERKLEKYFARSRDQSCTPYPNGLRTLYAPQWELSRVSPPDALPPFLGFHVLKDAPEKYRAMTTR